ncbi:SigE family RNA polymerase sigma factor [Streptomyces sp. 5-10]|nr:SigE family RNA polymerase sigma factor [Streptomyces sp. 5-10]
MSAPTDDAAASGTARAVRMDATRMADTPRGPGAPGDVSPRAAHAPENPDGLPADAVPADALSADASPAHVLPADSSPADPQAEFRDFFERHHAELARLAHLLLGSSDGADDLAADALVAVWHQWDRVRAADHPAAYARGVVANLARSRIRSLVRERRRVALFSSQRPDRVDDPDVSAVVDVQAALVRLPFRKRACVVLRHAFDLSERETARTLGISVGTVKSQTSRGIAELERLLGPPDGEDEDELSAATEAERTGRTVRTLRAGNTSHTGHTSRTSHTGPARHSGHMGHAGHAGGGS